MPFSRHSCESTSSRTIILWCQRHLKAQPLESLGSSLPPITYWVSLGVDLLLWAWESLKLNSRLEYALLTCFISNVTKVMIGDWSEVVWTPDAQGGGQAFVLDVGTAGSMLLQQCNWCSVLMKFSCSRLWRGALHPSCTFTKSPGLQDSESERSKKGTL